jgi:two-component system chemotaxis sensor kinase CheA
MVGELVIAQSMISQDLRGATTADKRLVRNISQFFRITSALQRVSTSLRMIPIKQTFQRMSRLVRISRRTRARELPWNWWERRRKSTATWLTKSTIRWCT